MHLLPEIWFRNTWSWGLDGDARKPAVKSGENGGLDVYHPDVGDYRLYFEDEPELLFCENETNAAKLYGARAGGAGYFKDGFYADLQQGIASDDARLVQRQTLTGMIWSKQFYYNDVLHLPNDGMVPLKVRSLVGLAPLFAVETLEPEMLDKLPDFNRRLQWVLKHRPDLADLVSRWCEPGRGERRLLSLLRGHRMKCLLRRLLDETEFLSDYGVRSLSRFHKDNPYTLYCDGNRIQCDGEMTVDYQPAESTTAMFVRAENSFLSRFWNEQGGFLYDVVDVDHKTGSVDSSFRPNQIFAVGGLPRQLLDRHRAQLVVDAVEQRLLTPVGLRSLAPDDPQYVCRYTGGAMGFSGLGCI